VGYLAQVFAEKGLARFGQQRLGVWPGFLGVEGGAEENRADGWNAE
jgi:hypothetical protein